MQDKLVPRTTLGAFVAAAALLPAFSLAQVTPGSVNFVLKPGESVDVTKTVQVPEIPPKLDLCLVVDMTGSYFDDLPNIKALAPGLFDNIRGKVANSQFCLGTFADFPFEPWGYGPGGDYAYLLNQNLTGDKTTWTNAINALNTKFGEDGAEAQYEALYQMATGAGRDVPPLGSSAGDIAAGQNPSFRADASKVIALTTDAPFHVTNDSTCYSPSPPCPFGYPGAAQADAVNALVAAGIKVIAIKAPGSGAEMEQVAAATGGSVVTTSNTSAEIADAILAGLAAIKQDITTNVVGCSPLLDSFSPASYTGVTGPATLNFVETLTVPANAVPGTLYTCSVEFKSGDTLLGVQNITVQVPLNGFMTGGGSVFTAAGDRVTHGFNLNCYSGRGGDNLEINFGGNAFHLTSLTQAACLDDPSIGEAPPVAGFDTMQGKGVGTFNGVAGYKAEWRFVDAGEPGRNDTSSLVITDPSNAVVLNVSGTLHNGNHQAHRAP